VRAIKRLSEGCIQTLRGEIQDARGNEVFALGYLDETGVVSKVEILARGNEGSVLTIGSRGDFTDPGKAFPALSSGEGASPPDVFIHNHPSGFLTPSDNDLAISARAAENGVGSFIIDNEVRNVYVVAEPTRRRVRRLLDADEICAALEEGGAIARRLPSYEPRPSQLDLMRFIVRGFNEDALAAAEAGTGVGKSFAYLLPAMVYALVNDERIVISTATITLQQQLYEKDIPLVAASLPAASLPAALSSGGSGEGAPPKARLKAVLVKGRGNYLCRRRLEDALREPGLDETENEEILSVAAWAETSKTGSRSDLAFMPVETVWSRVCSEADLCMGMRCPERERCFVLSLRKECADARILVVNHHLLFADLAARHGGAGYDTTVVLPPYSRVVIDEAHNMEDAATSFFSGEFNRLGLYRQLGRLYRKRRMLRTGLLIRLISRLPGESAPEIGGAARLSGAARLDEAVTAIGKLRDLADTLDEAALELCGKEGVFRLIPSRGERIEDLLFPPLLDIRRALSSLVETLRDMLEELVPDAEEDPTAWEIKSIVRRLEALGSICSSFLEYRERPKEVMWIERRRGRTGAGGSDWAAFTVTPIDVAPALGEALFEPNKTVVCLSATLTVADNRGPRDAPAASFAYWSGRSGIGLCPGRTPLFGAFPSPFPYARSVLLAVPADAPLPDQAAYRDFVDQAAARLAELAGGSALILFTSYEALRSAYTAARPVLEKQGIRCLKQGDDDRTRLLAAFLADQSSVLFATDSFWEGVDAPGDTLRLVILCRLPFQTPNDPVFEARCEALEKRGGNAFMELSLPQSVMKFKQGFGRLMRRSGDHGVVAVLDGRVLKKGYGEYFLRSLPKTRTSFSDFTGILREAEAFLFS
jgi:ATP-dependent DNA helicase DinG